jgi:phenylalanyl-tRNA synthetase beta chain
MLAPLSWLRDFAPLDAPVDRLAATLSGLGLVVEGVAHVGGGLDGVVVARILDIRTHPSADRIRLVDVDAGDGQALQIACGAHNFAVGDLVPLATIGTVLPDGMEIAARKMRGELSNGMLCAPDELGLPSGDDRGLLILPADIAPPGASITEALQLQPDVVFDLEVSPNRPDAMSMLGVARDLAAALGEPFSPPQLEATVDQSIEVPSVVVRDGDLCARFAAAVITGVPTGPSPAWLARRLTLAGMRPISAVVDASNYVMLELGQPNHAYDLDRLAGRGLIVRRARPPETLVTLDGTQRHLEADDCVICDGADIAVGVGGIMGGAAAEIGPDTRQVLLEAAWFAPQAIARTGKRLGLQSEARARFERGVDPEVARWAIDRFVALLHGARRGPIVDVRDEQHLPQSPVVAVRTARVNAVLGTELGQSHIVGLLAPIGFVATEAEQGVLSVTIPSWRPDSEREIDVIEEVARLYGYPSIARTLPPGRRSGAGLSVAQRQRRQVRDVLAGAGLSEAWTTTFLAPEDLGRAGLGSDAVEVENPLDRSESVLRAALLPGLLKALRYNVDRQWIDVRLFEIGRVFAPPPPGAQPALPTEREDVAFIVAGAGADAPLAVRLWTVLSDALRLEAVELVAGVVPGLHPSRAGRLVGPAGAEIGVLGEVDPDVVAAFGLSGRVGYFTADLRMLVDQPRRSIQARPVSRFPASDFDLALVVPGEVPAAHVASTLRVAAGEVLESLRLFDVYPLPGRGAHWRSLAFRLRLRNDQRTLTDAEVATVRQGAIDAVARAHGAELRA